MVQGVVRTRQGPMDETWANDKVEHNTERGPEEVAAEQNKAQGEKIKIIAEARGSSQQQLNRIVRFGKPDHAVSPGSGQMGTSRTTTPGMALAPRWCPPGLTLTQRRRIQRMRAQKLREEAIKKERDEHFNAIRSMIPMKQE
jgi:hypothetical protein